MAENRINEMSSSSSPTTTSSSPMIETNHTTNSNESKAMNHKNSLNAPKYGTPVPNRVFVGGIPTDTNENEVKQLFAKFGTVVSVKIINDRAGISRGYGFVTYETEEDAKRVMKESENLLIGGRKLNVSVAIKKQQYYNNDFNSRVMTNGSLLYNPFSLMNATNASLYPDFIYSSDGIPLAYNLGISPQLMASNSGISSTSSPYPYTYQTPSGLYLTAQPALAQQMAPQFQSSTTPSNYPLVSTSYRLPISSPNMSPNLNQISPYIHLSNASTPPLSQSSSLPIQVGSVANSMMSTDCGRGLNSGYTPLNLLQPSVYAISQNMANPSQAMACVQNVQLKADNSIDMCSDSRMSGHNPLSPQMVEFVWPQNVPNIQSPNKTAMNRYQYSKAQPNHTQNETTVGPKDRPDARRNNSSYNTSHYRKSVNYSNNRLTKPNNSYNSYGAQHRNSNYANSNSAENECQIGQNYDYSASMATNHSTPNTSALQGLPFVKHYSNNRFHTMPVNPSVLNSYQPSAQSQQQPQQQQSKHNSAGNPSLVPKMVNGVQIYALANYSAGDGEGYTYSNGTPLTPPLTPATHPNVKAVHK